MGATFVPCSVGRAPHKWKPSETVHTAQGRVTFHICAACHKREPVDEDMGLSFIAPDGVIVVQE